MPHPASPIVAPPISVPGLLANRRLRALVQVAVTGLVLFFLGRAVVREWDAVRDYSWQVQPLYLLAALGLTVARGPVILAGWWAVLARLGYRLPLRTAVRVYFQSGLAKYLPGSLWFAVGRVLLAEGAGVPKRITGVSIGLETALIVVAALATATLGLTALPSLPLWPYGGVLLVLLGALAWPRSLFRVLNWALRRMGRPVVDVQLRGRDLLALLPLFLANWAVYGLISFCWTAAVYPALAPGSLPSVGGLFAAAWVIGFLALVVPNGWGVREGAIITGLTGLLGVPLAAAGAAAVLSRLGTIAGEAIWAALALRMGDVKRET